MMGTTRDLLLQHWQEEKRIASHFSRIMRTRIWLSFGVPLFYAFASPWLEAALAVLVVLATGWIVRREFVSLHCRVVGELTQQLARTDAPELWQILDELQDRMGIQAAHVTVIVATRNYGDSPSVIDVEGCPRLVVPLGFFKVLGQAPGAAKAMLAHELAHVSQHDTRLWLLATAYLKGLKWLLLPYAIFAFLAVSLTSVLWVSRNKEQPEYTQSSLPTSQEGLRMRDEKADVITQPILAGLQILLLLAFARSVRQMRNRSEQAADLAAEIFAGDEELQYALEPHRHAKQAEWFSIHPAPLQRLQRIADFAANPSRSLQWAWLRRCNPLFGKIVVILLLVLAWVWLLGAGVGLVVDLITFLVMHNSSRVLNMFVSALWCVLLPFAVRGLHRQLRYLRHSRSGIAMTG
jgi:hypothetical protein